MFVQPTTTWDFFTLGFFIPLGEVDVTTVAVVMSCSLLGGLEELQAPSWTSCSRIGLFSQSGSPDCE